MSSSTNEFGHEAGALKAIAQRVEEAKGTFTGHARTLDGQIQGLQSKWQGEGGTAFLTLHNAWTEKHTKINNALDSFRDSLVQTESDNVSTDQQSSSNMNNLANKLGGI